MPGMTPEQITEAKALIAKAHEEVERLATGESRWRMTIPANPGRDSDLVISTGLGIGTSLIAEVERQARALDGATDHVGKVLADKEQLKAEMERLRESVSWIEARGVVFALERDEARSAGERVKALHSEFKIWDECGHRHTQAEIDAQEQGALPETVWNIPDVGLVCTDGYQYSVCSECCTEGSGYQTETCANDHDHAGRRCFPCRTHRALDGGEAS